MEGGGVWGCPKTGGREGEQKSLSEGKEGWEEEGWGFGSLKGISKYITFIESKGRD